MGRRGIKDLKARVGGSAALADGGRIEQWKYTGWRRSRRKSQCYNVV